MTPSIKGQYRRVHYCDDGVTQYQCLWCMNHIQIRDDPQSWNFCPKCGKSWFTRLRCRDRGYPRWAWDLWGDEPPVGARFHPEHKYPEWKWVIEERITWPGRELGEWTYETSRKVNHGELGAWREAAWHLAACRARAADDPDDELNDGFAAGITYEYRVRKEKCRTN
jgi:hypothetical protein